MTPLDHSTDLPCPSVQALLSEYLDGVLSPPVHQGVQAHLERCPLCVEQLADLQCTLAGVSNLQHTTPLPPGMEGVWSKIQQQLEQDQEQNSPSVACSYEIEFISAYHDGELSKTDPHFERFESHLNACSGCQEQLGKLQEISHHYQAWAKHLEADCSFTATEAVMAQLQALPACSQYDPETLSAFYDEALPLKETMTLSLHLEQCEACHRQLQGFHHISEKMQRTLQTPEMAALDLWPAVSVALEHEVLFQKRRQRWFFNQPKIAIPVAAAAVFLCAIFSMNSLTSPDANRLFQGQVAVLNPQGGGATSFDEAAPAWAPATHEGTSQMALHREDSQFSTAHPSAESTAAPTAEEYLFQQSHQELPDEELPLILGVPRP